MGTDADGKDVRAMGVEGNWNENIGGASRTERVIVCVSALYLSPRILDRSRAIGKPDDPRSQSTSGWILLAQQNGLHWFVLNH